MKDDGSLLEFLDGEKEKEQQLQAPEPEQRPRPAKRSSGRRTTARRAPIRARGTANIGNKKHPQGNISNDNKNLLIGLGIGGLALLFLFFLMSGSSSTSDNKSRRTISKRNKKRKSKTSSSRKIKAVKKMETHVTLASLAAEHEKKGNRKRALRLFDEAAEKADLAGAEELARNYSRKAMELRSVKVNINNEVSAYRRASPSLSKNHNSTKHPPEKTALQKSNESEEVETAAFNSARSLSNQARDMDVKLQHWYDFLKIYGRTGKHSKQASEHVWLLFLTQGWVNCERYFSQVRFTPLVIGKKGASFTRKINSLVDVDQMLATNLDLKDKAFLRLLEGRLVFAELNKSGYDKDLYNRCNSALSKAQSHYLELSNEYALRNYIKQAFCSYNSYVATFMQQRLSAWADIRRKDLAIVAPGLLKANLGLLNTMIDGLKNMNNGTYDKDWENFKKPLLKAMQEVQYTTTRVLEYAERY